MKTLLKRFTILCFFLPFTLFAQDNWESINTDRPGEGTDSPMLLPVGAIQLENGLFYQFDLTKIPTSTETFILPGLLRVGLLKLVELRFGYGYFTEQHANNYEVYDFKGFNPLSIGTKIHISEQKNWLPQMAIITSVKLPGTGAEFFESNYLDPTIRLLAGHGVNNWLAITTNFDINWDQELSEATIGYAVSFDLSFTDKFGGFAEFYGFLPEISANEHLFNAGLVYLFNNNLQLDTSAGFAFSEQAPDYFLSLGVSYRFKLF